MEIIFHTETTTNGQKYLYCYEENYQYPYNSGTGDVKVYIINPDLSEE
jgi:hypothetical protein